jgi:hypothetical protein
MPQAKIEPHHIDFANIRAHLKDKLFYHLSFLQ